MKTALPLLVLVLTAPLVVAEQPNIILLVADDLGYGEIMSSADEWPERVPTPAIDSIGKQGVTFTSAYVTAPNCSPSRAGFLTGKFPTRFGYEFNPIGARNEDPQTGLPRNETTLAELLHGEGYTTGLIGKWHLGGAADFHPRRHGFDEFFGFLHEGHFFVPSPWRNVTTMLRRRVIPGGGEGRWTSDRLIYSTHMGHNEPPYDANNPILRDGQPVEEKAYLTDAFTRESVDFIRRHQDKPFFLYVAYNAVHSPLQGKDEHMRQHAGIEDVHRRIFASMLTSLDESVASILKTLEETDLEKETLVIFLSDNGGPTRELTSNNRPLRGEKGQMFEGGIRVPMMFRLPGRIEAGRRYDAAVSSTDIVPTVARLAGASVPQEIDGVDLMPYLNGTNSGQPHEVLYWRQGPRYALRHGSMKLVSHQRRGGQPRWELYDLSTDPGETNNLSAAEPEMTQKLVTEWQRLNAQMREPLFGR